MLCHSTAKLLTTLSRVRSLQVPNQPNTCDCGVYLLHYVEKFFGLDLEKHLKELLGGKAGRRVR